MSTTEEINEVFRDDIARKTNLVLRTSGIGPFLDYFDGFQVMRGFDGLFSDEDLKFIQRIK